MLESIFLLYFNQGPVQIKNRNINSKNAILKLYNRQSIPQSIKSKTSINKTNAQPTRTYTLNYQLIKYYRTKTRTLKSQINNTKVFIILDNPHHSLKTHPKINRAKYQNSETAI